MLEREELFVFDNPCVRASLRGATNIGASPTRVGAIVVYGLAPKELIARMTRVKPHTV